MASALLNCVTYIASLATFLVVASLLADALPVFYAALVADVIATVVVFFASLYANNSSVYDPYWMVAPPVILLWLKQASTGLFEPWHARQIVAVALVTAWSLRFHIHLPWPGWWHGLDHEDWRYSDWRAKLRPDLAYWAFAFSSFHMVPTLIVFFALAPAALVAAATDQPAFGTLDIAGAVIGLAAIVIEAVADEQLRRYKQTDAYAAGEPCRAGLWGWSRHPNYFGEILMWSCMAGLASVSAIRQGIPALHCAWFSPAFTAVLLLRVSGVPMVEKAGLKKWGEDPAYLHYIKNTSCIIPWFPAGEVAEKKD